MPARNCSLERRSRLLPRRAANGPRSSRKQPFEAVLFRAVVADPVVHRAMMKVCHLLQPQRLLQQPDIMQRIEAVAANPGLNGPNINDKARKSGSHVTRRWRKTDSNPRSLSRKREGYVEREARKSILTGPRESIPLQGSPHTPHRNFRRVPSLRGADIKDSADLLHHLYQSPSSHCRPNATVLHEAGAPFGIE